VAAATQAAERDGVSVQAGAPFGDWLIWAAQQADRIDPLKESPAVDHRFEAGSRAAILLRAQEAGAAVPVAEVTVAGGDLIGSFDIRAEAATFR
jgi:hypothetical protein